MRFRLLFSVWSALALVSLAACEFHAEAGSPPATPSSTPAATSAPAATTAAPTATPATTSTVPSKTISTGHITLKPQDGGT